MADISKLSRLISGVSRGVALDANTPVVQNLKVNLGTANNFTFAGTPTANRTITVPDANVNLGLVGTAIQRDGSIAFTANQSMGGFKLTNLGTPTVDTDAATKLYVDTLAGGANLTLSNLNNPTAINQDLIFNKTSAVLKTGDTSGASSESLSVLTGTVTTSGGSGPLTLASGPSIASSGSVLLASGTSASSASATGAVTIRSGNATVGVTSSGPVTITTGTSIGTAVTGSLTLSTGISPGLAGSGVITMNSGNVTTNTSGASGSVTISSGTSVAGATGLTGNVSLTSGNHASPTSSAGTATLGTGIQTGTAFSGTGGATTVTTGNITSSTATGTTGATSILSGNTAGSGGATGAVNIRSGNATGTNSASGSVIIQTGSVVSGVRGTINMVDGSLAGALPGHVWTVSNTSTGAGNWQAPAANAAQNFITNGSIDNATASIFTTYNDSSTTRPVDGIGGSGITVTTSLTTTAPINGNKSVLLTKPASNCQGQGWAISDITIPPEFRGKPLRHYLAYLVNSGTFVAGANGNSPTDGDLIFTFYDQTNNKIVETNSIKFLASSTTLVDSQSGEIQFDSNCTTVRLIIHVASTSTAAFELKVDSVLLSPQRVNNGSFISNWSAQETTTGSLTNAIYSRKWRQEGDSTRERIRIEFTGTPGGTNPLVTNLRHTVDTAKLNGGAISNAESLGVVHFVDSSTGVRYTGSVCMHSTNNQIRVQGDSAISGNWGSTNPVAIAVGDFMEIDVLYPTLGFSASAKMSEPGDGRPYLLCANMSASQSIPNNIYTKLNLNVQTQDTLGVYDSINNRYRVVRAGSQIIQGIINFDATTAIVSAAVRLYVNGNPENRIQAGGKSASGGAVDFSVPFIFTYDFKAGDYWEIWVNQGSGTNYNVRGNNTVGQITNVVATDVQSSQQIAGGELVSARYSSSTGQSIPGLATWTIVNFATKTRDTHGLVATGSGWRFTGSTAAVFDVSARVRFANNQTWTANQFCAIGIFKNGALYSVLDEPLIQVTSTNNSCSMNPSGSDTIDMVAGDYFDIRAIHNESTARTLLPNAEYNFVNIKRQG